MIIQPSNVAPRTTTTNAAGVTTVTGSGYLLPYLPNVAQQTSEPQYYMTAYPLLFPLLTNVTATTAEPAEMQVLGRTYHAIQTSGTFVATITVEGTLDGTNWYSLGSITSAGIAQYNGIYLSIRVSVTAYTSGAVTVAGLTMRS